MIAFMILFFPAVLATWLYEKLQKTDLTRKQWLCRYCTNTLLINLFCFLVKVLILHSGTEPLDSWTGDVLPSTAANYLITALPAAVALSFVQILMTKHTKLEVEETHDEETNL